MKTWEALELGTGAVVADLHEFFIDELDAAQARRFQKLDLRLNEELKGSFGHEQRRSRTGRISDGGANVLHREVVSRVDAGERMAKDILEDVVDPGTSA